MSDKDRVQRDREFVKDFSLAFMGPGGFTSLRTQPRRGSALDFLVAIETGEIEQRVRDREVEQMLDIIQNT